MSEDQTWVEVKVWTKTKTARSLMRFRGELRDLQLDRDVEEVPRYRGEHRQYVPTEERGTLRWITTHWKMDHGSPVGFHCPNHDPNSGPGSDWCPNCGKYA